MSLPVSWWRHRGARGPHFLTGTSTAPCIPEAQHAGRGAGAFLPFTSREDVDFFSHLEMHIRQEHPPLSGRDHLAYRSAYFPVRRLRTRLCRRCGCVQCVAAQGSALLRPSMSLAPPCSPCGGLASVPKLETFCTGCGAYCLCQECCESVCVAMRHRAVCLSTEASKAGPPFHGL